MQVDIAWGGHFANELQNSRRFLIGIAAHSSQIEAGYEGTTGQPPNTVSREVGTAGCHSLVADTIILSIRLQSVSLLINPPLSLSLPVCLCLSVSLSLSLCDDTLIIVIRSNDNERQ